MSEYDALEPIAEPLTRLMGRLRASADAALADGPWEPLLGLTEAETAYAAEAKPEVMHLLLDHIEALTKERNEADRRAGAAEREFAEVQEELRTYCRVRNEQKREAGYGHGVSFDVVWSEILAKAKAWDALNPPPAMTTKEAVADYLRCECHRCIREKGLSADVLGGLPLSSTKMILCPTCGNKRCPRASDHDLACTGSNEPGQPGSVYP